jgi:hypothetical protein
MLQKRREQLRISQKAYRNRKRDEHHSLQKRLDELENGVHDINDAFLNISKLLLDTTTTEHRPHLASALREVTQQCLSLAEIVQMSTSASSQEVPESPSHSSNHPNADDSGLSETEQATTCDSTAERGALVQAQQSPARSSAPSRLLLSDRNSTSPLPSPASLSLTLTQTISSSEGVEFMHRLVRQCCLTAYQLLVHSPDLPRTQEIFGYIPPPSSRNQMVSALCDGILADDLASLQHRAKALSSLDSGEFGVQTPSPILLHGVPSLLFEKFAAEWLDVYGVQKALWAKGIRLETRTPTPEEPRSQSASSSSVHLDTTAFINSKSSPR